MYLGMEGRHGNAYQSEIVAQRILCTCLNESSEDILLYFLPDAQPKDIIRSYLALTKYEMING